MDTTDESPVIVTNGDESLQDAMDSQTPPASHSAPPALQELRLVLLGRKGAGKSAAGNTILGIAGGFESGKPTEECVKRRADVAGRKVTVVDTPGWEWYYPLNSTPNWVRRETVRSVSLCPPGPHAVLLVVRSCASVTEDYIREIEEHLEPLGKGVWEHTMLLFTRGDELGLVSMEQRILTSGPALQKLLQKCGNRYHVVDNRSKGDGTQVKELIRKLEEMVARKKGGSSHLEMDNAALVGLEADGKSRARERRKKQRQMEAQMQRGTIKAALMSDGLQGSELDAHHSFSKAPRRLPEVRLVLLGERETGKSSAGNTILGNTSFFQGGAVTEECVRQQAEVAKRLVTVVDTPGWEGGVAGATPERVKREIVSSVALCPPGPHALLLTLRVDTLVKAAHVKEHLELLGEGVWRHTILLFTHGDQLREGVDIEQHIQSGGRDLQWLLEKCRGRYHVIRSVNGGGKGNGDSSEVTELLQKVEKMAAMNRCEAFSGLVQDVRDLSRQRNEKFNQRLKDIGDKMLRQAEELKNIREREMKSIRWFFDWKKKVKSPGKADVQREEEEEEDRRMGERRNDIGELEERMRWLTEDKEKEIQDLSEENERLRVALNQSRGERDKAVLKVELKESEIEELTERIDEQQQKMLDLERAAVEKEQERKQREDGVKGKKQEWVNEVKKLKENIELQKKETAEWMERVSSLKVEMDETKRHQEDILQRKEQEKKREMAEMEERRKQDKDKEQEELRTKASEEKQRTLNHLKQREKESELKVEEMKSQHEKEMERKALEKETEIQEIEQQHQEEMARNICGIEKMMEAMKVQHQEEIEQKLMDSVEHMESVKQQHDKEIKDMQEEKHGEIADQIEASEREIADMEDGYFVQMEGHMLENEKEKDMIHLNYKKDMATTVEVLKLQHRGEMDEMEKLMETTSAEHKEEIERKVREKKEEVESVKLKYSDKISEKERETQREMRELEQQFAAKGEQMAAENENEKKAMNGNHEKNIWRKMQEKDGLVDELKRQHMNAIQDKTRQSAQEKKEMEQRLEEMGDIKVRVKEMTDKLRQKEENEKHYLSYTQEMEEKLEEGKRETEGIKEHFKDLEQQWQQKQEERDKDRLNHKKQIQQKLQEKEKTIEELIQQVKDVEEILQGEMILSQKKEAEQRLHDREREMEEMKLQLRTDTEKQLKQKETEIESVKQQVESTGTRWKEEQRKKDEETETELNRLTEIIDKKTAEITRAQCFLSERGKEVEEAKVTCAKYLKEIEQQASSTLETQQCHAEQERKRDADMMGKLQEKDEDLTRRDRANEREILKLKSRIEQTKSELKELTHKMEKETTSMIQGYEKEIARRNDSVETIAKERDRAISRSEEVAENYEDSRRRVEELQEENEKLRKDTDNLKIKYEDLKECEEEVRKHLKGYEEQAKNTEDILKKRNVEVEGSKEANDKLQVEIERRREEAERQTKEMRDCVEKEREMKMKDEEFLIRENEVEEREQALRRSEEELSQRGHDLDAKEEELVEKVKGLESREEEVSKKEASVEEQDRYEHDVSMRSQHIENKERELDVLLRALEGKQKELNCHGHTLQEKVKGLKDQGKELKDKECYLRNEEQGLLNWKSELQVQNQSVNSTTQQLDEMRRDLVLLKEELHSKERSLKTSLRKLGEWEQNLKEREQGLRREESGEYADMDCFDGTDAIESSEDDMHLMSREVSDRREKGTGRESDKGEKEREDQRIAESSNGHLEILDEIETAQGQEGMGDKGEETKESQRAKVAQDVQFLSPSQGHISSKDLRVVVLGESWSSRSPAGVTILCGDQSKLDDSETFRSWRGQIAGRQCAVAEPLGLKWRDGPDPTNTPQRKSILDSVSWGQTKPQIVLLLIPAFLTCTQKYRKAVEEHTGLLGEDIWKRTMVLFTWGEMLGESAEQLILRNGELMKLVEKCEGRYHVLSSKKSHSMIEGLLEKMEDVVALNNGEL
ncbi:trichohyalin isoform X2 [Pseudochaenichthys georgianus]|uniref:trichohyalin isoform X2 n=1 Tax=Pseudochaenichthys georgianus TaxID=52239 RepID=UPI00146C90A8|nr:trichohyalin isoform X2 [Pseudochaenichthys georgianus]